MKTNQTTSHIFYDSKLIVYILIVLLIFISLYKLTINYNLVLAVTEISTPFDTNTK